MVIIIILCYRMTCNIFVVKCLPSKMSSELINQSIIQEHLTSSEVMEKEDEIKENWCSKDCAGPLFAEKNDFSFEHLSSQSPMYQDLQSSVVCKYDTSPKNWEDLDISLRNLLPNENGITYVITSYASCSKESFLEHLLMLLKAR